MPRDLTIFETIFDQHKKIKRLKSESGDKSIPINAPFAIVEFDGEGTVEAYG